MTNYEQIRKLKVKALKKESLEKALAESDYKIIKCYEYSLVGLELPYDIQELHEVREKIREEIRSLEN
jgi:hypothetical protein